MTRISAWLEIESSRLPDCISSMLFSVDDATENWCRVALSPNRLAPDRPPLRHSSPANTLVRFELPADMRCAPGDTFEDIVSVGDALYSGQSKSGDTATLVPVAVPCLPAALARDLFFLEETARKEFESTLKRFFNGRGEWIRTNITDDSSEKAPPHEFRSISPPRGARPRKAQKQEKLVAAVATAVLLARSEIGTGRTVTFDVGTVALLRQLITGDPSVPNRKTLEADAKEIVKQLLVAARKHELKPGTMPRTIPVEQSCGLQLAQIVHAEIASSAESSSPPTALFPTAASDRASENESLDRAVFRHILTGLIESVEFPSIVRLKEIVETAKQKLGMGASQELEVSEKASEALSIILENIENADQRVDRFMDRFGELPAIAGVACVFWGWSSNPLENFEQRVQPLKAASAAAHQAARAAFAAAAGTGRLPPAYQRSRLWMAAYEATWNLLLSENAERDSKSAGKAIWKVAQSKLDLKESGPFLEARVGEYEIPMGLQIVDRKLAVRKTASELLASSESAAKTAEAILAAVDGDLSNFTQDLKKNVRRDVTIQLAKNISVEISGTVVTCNDLGERDLVIVHRWDDAEQAAGKLSSGLALDRILEGLPDPQLFELGKRLTSLGSKASD